jgi:hypothetical protein
MGVSDIVPSRNEKRYAMKHENIPSILEDFEARILTIRDSL